MAAATILVAVVLGAQVARLTVAGAFAETQPNRAEKLAPLMPDVLVSSAMTEVGEAAAQGQNPPPSTHQRLRQLSRVAPLEPEPFLVHGAIASKAGDAERAEQLLLEARLRHPRSAAARYLLADTWLRQGRIADGLRELAILSRFVPRSSVQLVPALAEFARTPGAGDQLKRLLSANPRLKRPLLNALAADTRNLPLILDLEESVPTSGEVAPRWQSTLLDGLIREGTYQRAYNLWQRLARFEGPRPLLFNAGFRRLPAPPPFNWSFVSGRAGFAEPGQGRMRVLHYGRENATLASQLLLLPPGSYRLSAPVSGSPVPGSLVWTLSCLPSGTTVMELELGPTASEAKSFRVPAADCRAQNLQLIGRAQDMPRESDVQVGPLELQKVAQ